MTDLPAYEQYWASLWDRLMERQAHLHGIQNDTFSDWRARKLEGLHHSEYVFYEVDRASATGQEAWTAFTGEVSVLYVNAVKSHNDAYAAGLELALACQRGFHPLADPMATEELLKL